MLERLTIQNYALIESLDIEFPGGLVIITGETGAGKSILLGAVSLLSGSRAEASILRDESRNCVVEAIFDTGGTQKILRRVISPSMRSRFFIDDEPVSAARMGEVSAELLDIHAQHSNLMISSKSFQLGMIDGYCGNGKLLEDYRREYEAVGSKQAKLQEISLNIERAEKESSTISSDLRKLEEAALVDGELEALEQEQNQLENATLLKESALSAAALLDGEEGSAIHNLKEAGRNAQKVSSLVPELESLVSRLESCRIECKDIASDLQRFASSIAASPARLDRVEERLDILYSLMRRFSCKDVESLIKLREELRSSAVGVDELILEKQKIEEELAQHSKKMTDLASSLTVKRRKGASEIQQILQDSIRLLEMPDARLAINIEAAGGFTADGADAVHILFTANPKEKMVELSKVASGGELSRIMLCIKSLMAKYMQMPTMFFDEIDVGVSGKVADKMGGRIVEMGKNMQVIAITHLPQVASKGDAHLLVYKDNSADGRNTVHLKKLDRKERIMEIARLLSGEKTTSQAIANAEVLLSDN